jgi:hypothetical protein
MHTVCVHVRRHPIQTSVSAYIAVPDESVSINVCIVPEGDKELSFVFLSGHSSVYKICM